MQVLGAQRHVVIPDYLKSQPQRSIRSMSRPTTVVL